MSKSSLTTISVPADSSNYTTGRKGYKVCKITPHHMAGVLSAESCGKIFQNASRNASSNYGIGNDGKIACYVEEENRAWTSSSSCNDCQAITIEVSNSSTGGDWPVSDDAWNALIELCVDICTRYGFTLNYTGDSSGSLTRHNMFANTDCPGKYLQSKFQELADTVNARLGKSTSSTTTSSKKSNEEIAEEVIAGKWGNEDARKTALTNAGYDYSAIQTLVNQKLDVSTSTSSSSSSSSSSSKSVTELANEVIAGKWGNGTERKEKLEAAGYNYSEVQAKVNELLGVSSSSSSSSSTSYKVGQTVTLKSSASKYCTGETIPSSVKNKKYTIQQVGTTKYPNGLLLEEIYSWVDKSDVQ